MERPSHHRVQLKDHVPARHDHSGAELTSCFAQQATATGQAPTWPGLRARNLMVVMYPAQPGLKRAPNAVSLPPPLLLGSSAYAPVTGLPGADPACWIFDDRALTGGRATVMDLLAATDSRHLPVRADKVDPAVLGFPAFASVAAPRQPGLTR